MRSISLILFISIGLHGCVFFYPKKIVYYDERCAITQKKLRLDKTVIANGDLFLNWNSTIPQCSSEEDCLFLLGLLISPLVVSAGTAIVSGSIVVAGNIVYWLEKRGQCATETLSETLNEQMNELPPP